MYKQIDFNAELKAKIQAYADEHCEGNFSFAVRVLCAKALS
jgi:hypothetical protein